MKSFTVLAVLISLVPQSYAAFTVNTLASVVQCQPALLSWQEGTAPYFPTIIPGGQVSASPLKSFDSTSSTQLTWNVDIAAGTSITIALRDSTGTQVYSDAVTISSSSDSSCLNSSVNEGSASASGASGTAAAAATSGASSSSSSNASASGASSTSHPTSAASHSAGSSSNLSTRPTSSIARLSGSSTSSGSASSSTASSGASRSSSMNAVGIAGLLGVVGAALL